MTTTELSPEVLAAARAELAKQDQPTEEVNTVVYTFEDVSYTLRKDAIEDLEVLELIEDEKHLSAVRKILGVEQWDRYKDAHRDESGRVRPDTFEGFLNGLFQRLNAGKA